MLISLSAFGLEEYKCFGEIVDEGSVETFLVAKVTINNQSEAVVEETKELDFESEGAVTRIYSILPKKKEVKNLTLQFSDSKKMEADTFNFSRQGTLKTLSLRVGKNKSSYVWIEENDISLGDSTSILSTVRTKTYSQKLTCIKY